MVVLADFTGSDLVTLREFDPDNFTLNLVASYSRLIPPRDMKILLSISSSLSARALDLQIPVAANDYPASEMRNQGYVDSGVKSALTLPVQVEGETLGTLGFASRSLDHYQEDTVRVLSAIGAVVGMMLTNAELHQDNEVEANIGRIVTSALVGRDVFERFTAEAARIIEFDRLALTSVDAAENTFVTEFLFGGELPHFPMGEIRKIEGTALEEIVRACISQRLILDEPDGLGFKYPNARPFVAAGQRFFLGVPLVVGDQVIGTLGFNRASGQFSRKDLTKAGRLANLVAGAFADFKQQEYRIQAEREISRNRGLLEAEAAIGKILSSPLNSTGASEALISEIGKIIPLDKLVIASIDIESETFSSDFIGFLSDPRLIVPNNPGQSYVGSITAEVVKHGRGQIVNSDDPRLACGKLPRVQHMIDRGYRTMMAVPLVFEETIIGTLIILSKQERKYSNEDMAVADRIGNLLAGALATFKISAERNRARFALSESEIRFRQIADSLGGVFWLTELDPPRLIYASPNAEGVWDVPLNAVYDDFSEIFKNVHPEDLPGIWQASIISDQTGEIDIDYRIIKRDGSVRWIHSRGFPVRDENGKLFRMSGIAEDVTDRKLEMERLADAGRLLSIGELASGVAHEINNPLANINLFAEGLLEQDLPAPVIEDLQVIFSQGKRAATVVRNLLQFARKSYPEVSMVAAKEFVERCIALKINGFKVSNISISVSVQLDYPEIEIDENLMTQVIVNILTNAEQACVSANRRGHISITVQEIDGSIRISIADDGPGISSEHLSKVFDPFFTTKEVGEGTGLGLSVSYGIIAQLGGNLWVESDGLTGATFHIEFPAPEVSKVSKTAVREHSNGDESASPFRVLVVDDEPDLRFILARLIERQGHSADQAGDGGEAWRKVRDQHYDCILLDLRMAGTGGQEFFQRISSSNPGLAANVIFITGDLANAKTRTFLKPLPNLVLEKPISMEQLRQAICVITERRLPSKASA